MKKYRALLFVLPVLACIVSAPAPAAEKAAEKVKEQKQVNAYKPLGEDVLRKMIERGSPSEKSGHSILLPLAGTWDYSAAFWTDQKVEPQRTMGTVTNEMIMEGRFLSSDMLGSLSVAGHNVGIKGHGLIGYDMAKKTYTSVWIDTMTTGMMIGTGKYDEKKKTIKETGKFTDPLDGVEKGFRSELQLTGAESYKRTLFTISKSGKESKLMEIEYTKKM